MMAAAALWRLGRATMKKQGARAGAVSRRTFMKNSAGAGVAPVASAAKDGFETKISAQAAGPYVQVQALDAGGNVIGTSATVKA